MMYHSLMEKLTVYVIANGWEYEGSSVVGVFYSEDKAKEVKEKLLKEKSYDDAYWVTVTPFTVK
jgi:hypothetical protein